MPPSRKGPMRRVTAKLSARARASIPKEVRERLGVGPGDTIEFEEQGGEVVVRAAARPVVDGPFAVFTEWASEADEEAYADLGADRRRPGPVPVR
jgi:antitoxin PrlF